MSKNLRSAFHCLDDEIVLDTLRFVSPLLLDEKHPGYVAGGIAVQTYFQDSTRSRSTMDLDIDSLWAGSLTDFRESYLGPFVESAEREGYEVSTTKKGFTYDGLVSKKGDSFVVQHPRRNELSLRKNRVPLERKIKNREIVEQNGIVYPVLRPEDLVLGKLSRIVNFRKNFGVRIPLVETPEKIISEALKARDEAMINLDELAIIQMRVLFDAYDISNLGNLPKPLNEEYFVEALQDFNSSQKREAVVDLASRMDLSFD